ncbi:hypothetical protein G6F61_014726 [Rhizopus arrhizus]|nr:hypothetical protein G6F61_014726 [Rhizopus arrhizus]
MNSPTPKRRCSASSASRTCCASPDSTLGRVSSMRKSATPTWRAYSAAASGLGRFTVCPGPRCSLEPRSAPIWRAAASVVGAATATVASSGGCVDALR